MESCLAGGCSGGAPTKAVLTVLTWNVSEFLPSHRAPKSWKTFPPKQSVDAAKLEILQHKPDAIALQESPHPDMARGMFGPEGYVSMGAAESHAGYVDLLFSERIAKNAEPLNNMGLPAVAATFPLSEGGGDRMAVASVHLAPHKGGGSRRIKQVKELTNALHVGTYVIAGDFNMREHEDAKVEALGTEDVGLTDCWKALGSKEDDRWTWDTYENKYFRDAFSSRMRFDRVYVHHGTESDFEVKNFSLVADRPMLSAGGPAHFLSDHFGLKATIEFKRQAIQAKDFDEGTKETNIRE